MGEGVGYEGEDAGFGIWDSAFGVVGAGASGGTLRHMAMAGVAAHSSISKAVKRRSLARA